MRLNTAVTIDHFLIHNRFSGIVACQIKKINILNRFCSPSPLQPKKKKKKKSRYIYFAKQYFA